MRRVIVATLVFGAVGAAVAFSTFTQDGAGRDETRTHFQREGLNPVTHLRWNDDPDEFQFAIVSDRTGGHRANVFSQAVHKLNLMQPAFVVSVGDLIEGGKKPDTQYQKEWQEFDGFVAKLTMPFFYVSGNHDVGARESAKFWEGKLGRKHYHFVYRGVLFIALNSDDPPGSGGAIGAEQAAWVKQVAEANRDARWTIVLVHRPLWAAKGAGSNGWKQVEESLGDRRYTVFAGHIHRFEKFTRNGRFYYQLATTGGSSVMRGVEAGEFDHITWVTMKKDGPLLAHVTLDAIHAEDLKPAVTDEPGSKRVKAPVYAVRGQAYFEGTPMPGAVVLLTPAGDVKKAARASGRVAADGSFTLTTYRANDGAAAGEYTVTVFWRERLRDGQAGASLLPARYGKLSETPLKAVIQPGAKNELVLELKK
ncbi:MAG: metallophosphoesterase [Gemmataceae bacterium]|nr:metallophosphoesterase [Gemmataceae bacterium]